MSSADSEIDFLSFYDAARERLFSRIEQSCTADLPWHGRLRSVVAATLDLFAADPSLARALIYEVDAEGLEMQDRHRDTQARLADLLRQGREEADAPSLPEHTEETLIGGLLYIIGRPLRAGEIERLPTLAPDVAEFLLTPYFGPEEAHHLVRDADD